MTIDTAVMQTSFTLGNQKKIEERGLRIEIGAYQKLLRGKKAKSMLA